MRYADQDMKRNRIDVSDAAVAARLKRACNLGDIEIVATAIRSHVAEIRGETEIPEQEILIAEREGRLIK